MNRNNRKRILCRTIFSGVALIVLLAGCGSMEFASKWRAHEVTIDGKNLEWGNVLTRIEDVPMMVGAVNDSEYLYVTIQTSDRPTMRQIMFRGFTIWFDRTGGEEKRFGIRYPLGMQGMGVRMPPRERGGDPGGDELAVNRMPIDTTEIEILGPMENERHRMSVIQLQQISAKFQIREGSLVYEVRIPLMDNGSEPYAIGTSAGSVIGIGLETGARMERPAGEEATMPPPGGEGMRGGRGRGGMEGPPGGGRMGMQSKPLNVWSVLKLAVPAAAEGK